MHRRHTNEILLCLHGHVRASAAVATYFASESHVKSIILERNLEIPHALLILENIQKRCVSLALF